MKKSILAVLVLGLVFAVNAYAADYSGMGCALLDKAHPIGVAFAANKENVIRLGLGFSTQKFADSASTTGGTTSKFAWDLMGVFDHTMYSEENTNITVGVSGSYGSMPGGIYGDASSKAFTAGVQFGAEHWFSKKFSVNLHHGIKYTKVKDNDFSGTFGSTGDVFGEAGFTLWSGK